MSFGDTGLMADTFAVRKGADNGTLGVLFEFVQAIGGTDAYRAMPHHVRVPEAFQALTVLAFLVVFVETAKNQRLSGNSRNNFLGVVAPPYAAAELPGNVCRYVGRGYHFPGIAKEPKQLLNEVEGFY